MVDLNALTQEQQWGVEYACLEANKPKIAENERIAAANASLAEGAEPQALVELFTPATYLESVIRSAASSYYQQLLSVKKQNALAMFDALSPAEQAALVAQLGIPDVLPG